MRHACRRLAAIALLTTIGSGARLHAQESIALTADVLFYGDNTEFRNPFREGETLFGAAAKLGVAIDVNERVRLALGAFGNQRFGSDDAFEQVRPVIALEIVGQRSSFVFGTLPTPRAAVDPGPDRTGPHGLLPPIQRETLAFERPYEAGMMWRFSGRTLRHELWLEWQRLNTSEHRERFDAGANGAWNASRAIAIPFQLHIVHEGGQQFAVGPVADSVAAALGVAIRGTPGRLDAAELEVYGLASRFVPDREDPDRSRSGAAVFARASASRAGWRGHLIVWRGDDFVKDEGDPNYLSIRRDGTRYRGVRDYAEAGVTRTFRLAPGVTVETSGRLHRVERHYEYSYRVLGVVTLRHPLRK